MKQAADKVRALRYGVDGYFWVDLSDGTNVVLLGNDIEGTNRLATEDVTGFRMVKDFIEGAVAQGSYYCDYQYPKEGGTEPMPKRAYTEYFKPLTGLSAPETTSTILMRRLTHPRRRHTRIPTRK